MKTERSIIGVLTYSASPFYDSSIFFGRVLGYDLTLKSFLSGSS